MSTRYTISRHEKSSRPDVVSLWFEKWVPKVAEDELGFLEGSPVHRVAGNKLVATLANKRLNLEPGVNLYDAVRRVDQQDAGVGTVIERREDDSIRIGDFVPWLQVRIPSYLFTAEVSDSIGEVFAEPLCVFVHARHRTVRGKKLQFVF